MAEEQKKFYDFPFDVASGDYVKHQADVRTQLITLGRGRDTVEGIHTFPDDEQAYLRIELLENATKLCALVLRATNGYLIGFEAADSRLFEISPNEGAERHIDVGFSLFGGHYNPTHISSFTSEYKELIRAGGIGELRFIDIGCDSILGAARRLSRASLDERGQLANSTDVAQALATSIVVFCESLKFRNIQYTISEVLTKRINYVGLGPKLSKWVNQWANLSRKIAKGKESWPKYTVTISSWGLKDEYDNDKKTVEDVILFLTKGCKNPRKRKKKGGR